MADMNDDLVGYWKMNEKTGLVAYDSSGNGKSGSTSVNFSGRSVQGRVGSGAVSFATLASNNIYLPSLVIPITFSLIGSVQISGNGNMYNSVISLFGGKYRQLVVTNTTNQLEFYSDETNSRLYSTPLSLNIWYRVGVTCNGSTLKLYLNGIGEVINGTYTLQSITTTNTLLGGWTFPGFLNGALQE